MIIRLKERSKIEDDGDEDEKLEEIKDEEIETAL